MKPKFKEILVKTINITLKNLLRSIKRLDFLTKSNIKYNNKRKKKNSDTNRCVYGYSEET